MQERLSRAGGETLSNPLVSVVIPVRNRERTILRALASVAIQDYEPIEVIVIDDASDDATPEILSSYTRLPLIVRRQSSQSGASTARNVGIALARGEYIAFLDSDDEWLPGKLAKQVSLLRSRRGLSLVSCYADVVSPEGTVLGRLNAGREPDTGPDAWKTLLRYSFMGTPCVVARTDAIRVAGGFDPTLRIAEDQDLWIRLAMNGEIGFVFETLVDVYISPTSLSGSEDRIEVRYTLPMIRGHIERNRHRLSPNEISDILGQRYTALGRSCYAKGNYRDGLSLLFRAIALRHRPLGNLCCIAKAWPPLRPLKRVLGLEREPERHTPASLPADSPPLLLVIIDTEEEFDWSEPFSRDNCSVRSIARQHLAQEIFERYGIVPTYVADYAVVQDAEAAAVLSELLGRGACLVGAHLHPWVNPPDEEEVGGRNSYPGNLPYFLEYRKLATLTAAIESRLGVRPVIYRAGRYGVGPATHGILNLLGYAVDTSVLPYTDLTDMDGPDFRCISDQPVWVGDRHRLLELPVTVGFVGLLAKWGDPIFRIVGSTPGRRLRLAGILARLGLLRRATLTPEGNTFAGLVRLAEAQIRRGRRVFSLSYHSSSLLPGSTPYVTSEADLAGFLDRLDRFCDYFINRLGGRPATPIDVWESCRPGEGTGYPRLDQDGLSTAVSQPARPS